MKSLLRPTTLLAAFALLLTAGELSAQPTELRRGRTLTGTIAAGDTARYTFEADADDFVLGEVNQISVDVTIRVLDPDGQQRARFGGLGRGHQRFGGQTSSAGTYTVELFATGDDDDAARILGFPTTCCRWT